MEYIIPGKLIDWNIIFCSLYLEFLNVVSWKTIEKYQIFPQKFDIPGICKFYCNWNNSSETAPISIFIILFKRLALS